MVWDFALTDNKNCPAYDTLHATNKKYGKWLISMLDFRKTFVYLAIDANKFIFSLVRCQDIDNDYRIILLVSLTAAKLNWCWFYISIYRAICKWPGAIEHEKRHLSFSNRNKNLDYCGTHTKKKKAFSPSEHSQLGESEILFTCQMTHFIAIWCNDEQQWEPQLYTSRLWHIWLNRKMYICILHLEYLCIFKNYLWYLSTVAVTFFTFPCRRFIGAQSGLSVSSSELGLPLKNKFAILQADFKSYLKEILCNIALEVWKFF